MKKLAIALLVLAAAALGWGVLRKHSPPKINFATVKRSTLVSTLPTNGKVEPFEWQAMRAERAGVLGSVMVREGQEVHKDEVIATVSDPSFESGVQGAEARVAEARANLSALESGGKPAELADIENSLKQARLELEHEQKNSAALERLVQKQAATPQEAAAAREKAQLTETAIEGLERRRQSLVAKSDVAAAQARLQDAQAALTLAREGADIIAVDICRQAQTVKTATASTAPPPHSLRRTGQLPQTSAMAHARTRYSPT